MGRSRHGAVAGDLRGAARSERARHRAVPPHLGRPPAAGGGLLVSWMQDPALSRIWTVLRDRLEARGRCAEGRIVLSGLSRPERHAASALFGRPVTKDRLTIDLAA